MSGLIYRTNQLLTDRVEQQAPLQNRHALFILDNVRARCRILDRTH